MKDKKQDEISLEELVKAANAIRDFFTKLGDELSKVLANIKVLKENTWEMKCPYENNDDIYTLSNDGEVKKTTGHISIMTENVLSKVTSSQPKKQPNLKLNAEIYLHVLERSGMNVTGIGKLIGRMALKINFLLALIFFPIP